MTESSPAQAATREESAAALVWGMNARQAAVLAGILIVTVIVYLPSLRNGWVLDDRAEFVDNKLIHTWSFVWNSLRYDVWWFRDPARLPQSPYYRPLENEWFAANALLFGTHPALWHLAKIAVHVVVVALSFRLAQLLAGDVAVGLVTAAIFAVMPANAGAVLFASAIPEPLSTAFELGAMICIVRRKPDTSRWPAALLYACALLTHESAILFPLIVAAYFYIFVTRRLGSILRRLAPFAIVLIAYMCARLNALGLDSLFGLHLRTTGTLFARGLVGWRPTHSAAQLLMTLPQALLTYLAVLALPGVAGPAHDVSWITHLQPIVFIDAAALLILAAAAFVLARRSPSRDIYLFCAIWMVLTMAPALNLNSILWLVDDRYLYAPSFGWSLAVAVTAVAIASSGSIARNVVGFALATTLALYLFTTVSIQRYWHDDVAFFSRTVEIAPDIAQNRLDLAAALNRAGRSEEAAGALESAVALNPNDAHTHLKLAQQYQKLGRELDFEREFQKFNELSAAMAQSKAAADAPDGSQPEGEAPGAASSP